MGRGGGGKAGGWLQRESQDGWSHQYALDVTAMARWKLPDTVNVEHVLMEPMVMGHSRSPYPFSTPPTVKHFASVVSPVTQRFLFPTKLCCLGSSRSARSDLGRLDTEEAGRVPSVGLGAGQERSDIRAVVLGTFLWFSQ